MDAAHLRNISNSLEAIQLVSLRSWSLAAEYPSLDKGGPYVVAQQGYDPEDLTVTPDEFILGKCGGWIPARLFFQLPLADRRAEFIFASAAEVAKTLSELTGQAKILRSGASHAGRTLSREEMELNEVFEKGREE